MHRLRAWCLAFDDFHFPHLPKIIFRRLAWFYCVVSTTEKLLLLFSEGTLNSSLLIHFNQHISSKHFSAWLRRIFPRLSQASNLRRHTHTRSTSSMRVCDAQCSFNRCRAHFTFSILININSWLASVAVCLPHRRWLRGWCNVSVWSMHARVLRAYPWLIDNNNNNNGSSAMELNSHSLE